METGVHGIFAAGDVRSGSVKRVGAAIGEGAAIVAQLHSFLARRGSAQLVDPGGTQFSGAAGSAEPSPR
jgi:thioredoxin reductase (NADPH)